MDKHVPPKKKHINAKIRKAIMKSSKLRQGFAKDKSDVSQSNVCATLSRQVKKSISQNKIENL